MQDDHIVVTMQLDKEDQGGVFMIDRPVHSNPSEPLLDFFLWLGVRILCCPGAYRSPYIVGDENVEEHTVAYKSKVSF